jgi:RNA polymerase sigma-70 factor (ECF subfamily)
MSLDDWVRTVRNDEQVLATVMRVARNRERAEDAIQEALTRAVENCPPGYFKSYEHFRRWVVVVARNHLVTEWRSFCRQQPLVAADTVPDRTDDGSAERIELVRQAIEALPAEERELVRRYFEEDWTYKQLAEGLGCSITNAWKRIRRALAQVRKWLLRTDPDLFTWLEKEEAQSEGPAASP